MTTMHYISPSDGWAGSCPRVLLWPLVVYGVFGLFMSIESPGLMGVLAVSSIIGLVIHFISYFLIGLPLYLYFWERHPALWSWGIGLPLGAVLGAFPLVLVAWISESGSTTFTELSGILVLGGSYGMVTAAAAITSRKKRAR